MFCFSVRSGSKQLATIINFLLSIAATFAFGFIASQYAFPSLATVCNTDVCMTTVFLNYFSLFLANYSYFQLLPSLVCLPGMVFRLILFTLTLFQICLLKYTTQRVTPPPPFPTLWEVKCGVFNFWLQFWSQCTIQSHSPVSHYASLLRTICCVISARSQRAHV